MACSCKAAILMGFVESVYWTMAGFEFSQEFRLKSEAREITTRGRGW